MRTVQLLTPRRGNEKTRDELSRKPDRTHRVDQQHGYPEILPEDGDEWSLVQRCNAFNKKQTLSCLVMSRYEVKIQTTYDKMVRIFVTDLSNRKKCCVNGFSLDVALHNMRLVLENQERRLSRSEQPTTATNLPKNEI